GVWTQLSLVESGGGLRASGDSMQLSCQVSVPNFEDYSVRWFRQARGGGLEWVSYISGPSGTVLKYGAAVDGRAAASRNNSQAKSSLSLQHLHVGDSGRYFCAVQECHKYGHGAGACLI
uniref:Ig-like domain-containing protein n=1 Tax=Anas zonorhyncha TaxID=75864 RepID=A0A8B9ULV3_9AVES